MEGGFRGGFSAEITHTGMECDIREARIGMGYPLNGMVTWHGDG